MAIYYIDPVLAAAAIIPAVVLLIKVYQADRLEKEPVSLILSLVFFGVLSTAIAMVLEQVGTAVLGNYLPEGSVAYNAVLYFGIVAFSEEGAKYLLLKKRTWRDINFNCQFDGVVYGMSVSLGFALWENLGYVAMYGFGTALVRAVTAVPGHACFGAGRARALRAAPGPAALWRCCCPRLSTAAMTSSQPMKTRESAGYSRCS